MSNESTAKITEEWVLGPDNTPFYTKEWTPSDEPKAFILFVHGFAEHISRYDKFFTKLASSPSSIHITAFDQRGHGRTSHTPLTSSSPEVIQWKKEGKVVKLEKNGKRRTGGWNRVMPDIEWFVLRESERAKKAGKKLFLHGFSMGGGQVLAFASRPESPPSSETIKLLSGVIAGGPLIRQTRPASGLQVKAGSMAAGIGLGSMLIPTPLDCNHLSHNDEVNEKCKNDPFCEQVGSLKGVADMLNGGIWLDSHAAWKAWPKDLPLLLYHGEEDNICDHKATKRFGENVNAHHKKIHIVPGMYHEVHNELEPVPSDLANMIAEWVHEREGVVIQGSEGAQSTVTGTSLSKL